jgi:hypothetical protein
MKEYNVQDIDVPKGGYPDMGNGKFGKKLGYREWFEFNTAQRAH